MRAGWKPFLLSHRQPARGWALSLGQNVLRGCLSSYPRCLGSKFCLTTGFKGRKVLGCRGWHCTSICSGFSHRITECFGSKGTFRCCLVQGSLQILMSWKLLTLSSAVGWSNSSLRALHQALPWKSWCLKAASPQLPPGELMATCTPQHVGNPWTWRHLCCPTAFKTSGSFAPKLLEAQSKSVWTWFLASRVYFYYYRM